MDAGLTIVAGTPDDMLVAVAVGGVASSAILAGAIVPPRLLRARADW